MLAHIVGVILAYPVAKCRWLLQRLCWVLGSTFCLLLFSVLLTAVQIYAHSDYQPCAYQSMCLPEAHEGMRWRVVRSYKEVGADVVKANARLPTYQYYWIAGYGLTDMSHLRPSHHRMEEILDEMTSGTVVLQFELGRSYVTDARRQIWGLYRVQTDLNETQAKRVAMAIALDFVSQVESYQSPGSSFSVEDLPSDYLGAFLGLNPEWTEQRLFLLLGKQRAPVGLGEVRAHIIKLFRKNRDFRPIPYPGGGYVDWPRKLYIEPAARASGLWESFIYITPEQRTWWQKGVDWTIQACHILTT